MSRTWRSCFVKKHFPGNILFLVVFIMFISSLLWLLVSEYVSNMIKISSIFQNYYHTYYLTYGWLELWLTQIKYHGYGFQDTVTFTGTACITSWCSVQASVISRSPVVANNYEVRDSCSALLASWGTDQTYTSLTSGDCFITPLYFDQSTGFGIIDYFEITSAVFAATAPDLYNQYLTTWTAETYTIRIIDEELENSSSTVDATVGSPSPNPYSTILTGYDDGSQNYLIIANASAATKQFCHLFSGDHLLPMKYATVTSIWVDGKNTIALNAIKNNEIPSFLCYGTINP